jgi:rare lipoprotein A
MTFFKKVTRGVLLLSICAVCATGPVALASGRHGERTDHISFSPQAVDYSGETRVGIASFYARRFGGRRMADGTPMRLAGDNAASLTLPLGTVARVTNLSTRRSAIVVIRDRGPYVRGRLIDLSPGTAARIGLERREGLATVAVEPLHLPSAGDSIATAGLLDVPASPSW